MFYEEDEINELLICPNCKNKYDDPRLVECGASFCFLCLDLLINKCDNGFKCIVCNEFHEIPHKGFAKNLNLAKLCDKQANEVSRSQIADGFKSQLVNFKSKLDGLSINKNLCVDKIREHCDELRNEVQLTSEQLVESIKKYNIELIEQINAYEQDSIQNYNKEIKQKLDIFVCEMSEFYSKWNDYLKRFKIDDNELKKAASEANQYLERINQENDELLDKIGENNVLKFEKSPIQAKSSMIGTLITGHVKLDYEEQLNNLKKHDLSKLGYNFKHGALSIRLLNNYQICIAYRKYSGYNIDMALFDYNFNKIIESNLLNFCRDYQKFYIIKINNSIYLYLTGGIYASNRNLIVKLDTKLNALHHFALYHDVISLDAYKNNLYCLSTFNSNNIQSNNNFIHVYDENLIRLMCIGQSSFNFPFYIPRSIKKLRVNESYYVLLNDSNEIILMDKKSGAVKNIFSIDTSEFVLNTNSNNILTYCSVNNKLVCFNLDGRSKVFYLNNFHEDNLKFNNKNIELFDSFNDRLAFFDPQSLLLFF